MTHCNHFVAFENAYCNVGFDYSNFAVNVLRYKNALTFHHSIVDLANAKRKNGLCVDFSVSKNVKHLN